MPLTINLRRAAIGVALAIITLLPLPAGAMTVAEAYAAIPHNRTTFDAARSSLPRAQASELHTFFDLVDRAVVLRVVTMRAIESGAAREAVQALQGYDRLIAELAATAMAPDAAGIRDLVAGAVREQRRFLAAQAAAGGGQRRLPITTAADVRNSSQKLQQAYGMLMQRFARETGPNKTAFFDHLCALDFL